MTDNGHNTEPIPRHTAGAECGPFRRVEESWASTYAGRIIAGGAALGIIITVLSLTFLPSRWGSNRIHASNNASAAAGTPATTQDQQLAFTQARTRAENDVRDLGLKIAAGVGAITAALVGYGRLDLSKREYHLAEQQFNDSRHDTAYQRLLGERGQNAERYTRAIDQLGSEKPDIQTGGLYGLEALAKADPTDAGTIADVISAYIRGQRAGHTEPEPVDRPTKAALAILGRNPNLWRPDLAGIDLRSADLRETQLKGLNLNGADLTHANLRKADLTGSTLRAANLSNATIAQAILVSTDLEVVNWTDADVSKANLTDAQHLNREHIAKALHLIGVTWPDGTTSPTR